VPTAASAVPAGTPVVAAVGKHAGHAQSPPLGGAVGGVVVAGVLLVGGEVVVGGAEQRFSLTVLEPAALTHAAYALPSMRSSCAAVPESAT
jgi:hypothetical protein